MADENVRQENDLNGIAIPKTKWVQTGQTEWAKGKIEAYLLNE